MENHELLPFERNRYYHGKLLTSSDFQTEQSYFNNKRRFLNDLVFGAGVLCGLGVYSLDDVSVMIESGVAIDGRGREVAIENSVVKKLSTIDGFEALSSGKALLCLRYREEAVHPTYSISRQAGGEEYELNRIREGWDLFVADPAQLPQLPALETDFFSKATLYEDDDFRVEALMPANVSRNTHVKLIVRIHKCSAAARVLSLDCLLQVPSFLSEDGSHELAIQADEVILAEGEESEMSFWLYTGSQLEGESLLIAKPQNMNILVDGIEKKWEETCLLKVGILDEPVYALVNREVGRITLEALAAKGQVDYIPLALLDVQITQNTYVIESVDDRSVKHYIPTAAQDELRRQYSAYFEEASRETVKTLTAEQNGEERRSQAPGTEPLFATGVCEIPLGAKPRRGNIFYSEEIMHGLGAGNIHVEVGFEYLSEDVRLTETAKNTIYGDVDLFAKEQPPVPIARTAVKVMNDRGSFVAAVKLMKDSPYVVVLLRWVATRLPSEGYKNLSTRIAGKSISAEQPTVVLATRESHFFNVKFRNMEPTSLSYTLTENNSGEITPDGVYTAPGREGVYEIRIYCTDQPLINTYAYAIVKKREHEGEPPKAEAGTDN